MMIEVGLAVLIGLAYFSKSYDAAFALVTLAILYVVLTTAYVIIFPVEYWLKQRAGVGENPFSNWGIGLRSFVPKLLAVRGLTITIMAAIAWHIGKRAGYF